MAGRRRSAEEEEDVDHYDVLGLPSGEEGAKLTLKEIEKAFRKQSRIRHPDKRPDDPNATADFQCLKISFELLKDEPARRAFDARLRARRDRLVRDSALDAKRRKLARDLEERERAAEAVEAVDPVKDTKRREKDVAARLREELVQFHARRAKKSTSDPVPAHSTSGQDQGDQNGGTALDKERMLKVSWEGALGDYSAMKLQELFEKFGGVEDVFIRSKGGSKRGSAIVVMLSKDAVALASHNMNGIPSNPLIVLPLQVASSNVSSDFHANRAEAMNHKLGNIIGAGFKDFEVSIMKKLQKANEQKESGKQTQL